LVVFFGFFVFDFGLDFGLDFGFLMEPLDLLVWAFGFGFLGALGLGGAIVAGSRGQGNSGL